MEITAAQTELASIAKASGGCAAKLGPAELARLLEGLPPTRHPDLLIPAELGADSGVLQISPELALVQSVDFFPPMLSDARAFGRIAAANALSDIYCVGARPVSALSLLAMPREGDFAGIRETLLGAREILDAAGVVGLGGHTIIDKEVKFGLAVTGLVHPRELIRHNTPQAGDALVLTKPLGSGILVSAYGKGLASEEDLTRGIAIMSRLNRQAAELLRPLGAHAATDVTGFGLLNHARDMLSLGGLGLEIRFEDVPVYPVGGGPGLSDWIAAGAICGGTARNMEFSADKVDYGSYADKQAAQVLLNDAQTSGGLLIALPEARARELLSALGADSGAALIGTVTTQAATMRIL